MPALTLEFFHTPLSVCKVKDYTQINIDQPLVFTGRTDEEKSLVCPTAIVPENVTVREDGWMAFRISGELNFSLIGILSEITGILAANQIGVFAVSTYNTDYVLTREKDFKKAEVVLEQAGYQVQC